jgi:hypothetical protein
MGNTQKTGNYVNAIFQDTSNNIGIGGSPSGSYKLEVTGTAKVSSTLLVSGAATFSSSVNVLGTIVAGNASNIGKVEIGSVGSSSTAQASAYLRIGDEGAARFWLQQLNSSYDFTIRHYNSGWSNPLMTITTSGNVGIGTSSPGFNLSVKGSGDGVIYAVGANNTYKAEMQVEGAGQFTGSLVAVPSSGSTYQGIPSSTVGIATSSTALVLATSGSERMRITSGGNVCINSTSPLDASAKLNVSGYVYFGLIAAGAGNSTLKYNTSTGLMSYDTSARAFKKDIVDLEYGLDAVLKMSSKKYKWKLNETEDLGFIADEMYKIIPEVVFLANNNINQTGLEDNEPMGINYDRLVPVLVKAIQELNERLNKAGL